MPDYTPKEVKRILKEKQRSFDAVEHFRNTILKDEAAFDISDFKERTDVKNITHLYTKRNIERKKRSTEMIRERTLLK